MVPVARKQVGRGGRWLAPLILLGFFFAPGCFHLDRSSEKAKPCGPIPTRVVMAWVPRVEHTPDPTRGGTMSPGLVSRLYLFGEDLSFPLVCEGTLHVELYDATPRDQVDPVRKRLEEWTYDPVALQKCVKKDMFGDGYTLFFPWTTFRPDISRVELRTTFTPSGTNEPRYGQPSIVNLSTPFTPRVAQHAPVGPNIETKVNKPQK